MVMTGRDNRFFASTRGQVVTLLRRGGRTVDELARELDLTDNAVRVHLAALERDGLVRQAGLRRGVSRPAYAYELTPEAERLFPKAYGTLVHELLDVLTTRLPPEAIADLLREVGRRMAEGQATPAGNLRERAEHAARVLGELGGLAEVEDRDGAIVIRGCSCPIAAAVADHPEACELAEALLAEVMGVPVRQCCDQGPPPRCAFEVGARP